MTIYNWLTLLGVPAAVGAVWAYLINQAKQVKAVKAGLQALLRAKLVSDYEKYKDAETVPIYVKESFERVYYSYHSLGKNGVMDSIHDEIMSKKAG